MYDDVELTDIRHSRATGLPRQLFSSVYRKCINLCGSKSHPTPGLTDNAPGGHGPGYGGTYHRTR